MQQMILLFLERPVPSNPTNVLFLCVTRRRDVSVSPSLEVVKDLSKQAALPLFPLSTSSWLVRYCKRIRGHLWSTVTRLACFPARPGKVGRWWWGGFGKRKGTLGVCESRWTARGGWGGSGRCVRGDEGGVVVLKERTFDLPRMIQSAATMDVDQREPSGLHLEVVRTSQNVSKSGRTTHDQLPAQSTDQLSLQQVQLLDSDPADFGIMSVCAERVAQRFRSDARGGDEESMDGK
jgi:hypothetical protein